MTRPRHVYQLEIIYPEGSRAPGWRPDCWSDPAFLTALTKKQRRELAAAVFRWPRERMFLSSSGAYRRAALLRWYGAEAEVLPSDPVTWPNYDDAASFGESAWVHGEDAAQWAPGLDEEDVPTGDAGLGLLRGQDECYAWLDEAAEFARGTAR